MAVVIEDVYIEHLPEETCKPTAAYPQGAFPKCEVKLSTGEVLCGKTCGCLEGHVTYGTWRIPPEKMRFESREAVLAYMNKDDSWPMYHSAAAMHARKNY